MAKYLARKCPKCGGYFGVVVIKFTDETERPVIGSCSRCGYAFKWSVLAGRRAYLKSHQVHRNDECENGREI